ncbi:hypothetical protein [Enhygromyxa salina]|uniref:hypothetical protein n=1 Tax=Enhygromyxa salina TaxID=215803 RepID=UPI000698D7F7|nr:hypothetical protein [Enhygromyxa salina]
MTLPPNSPSCASVIETAIRGLSDADWSRLRQAARILAWKVPSVDAEALLFDALERTLDGRRRWKPAAVDFIGHLVGVMRSVSTHEAARRGLDTIALTSSMDAIGVGNPEDALSAEQQIRRLRAYFGERNDDQALRVLDAMELGCDGPAIRMQLDLAQTQLETIVRRIRRAAHRVLPA